MPDVAAPTLSFTVPSWMRWPPNCCETCVGWKPDAHDKWIGICNSGESLEMTTRTDARFRCPSFERRADV